MTNLVLAIHRHDGDETVMHKKISSFPVTIGRAYNNDIILSDPHIAACQVCISLRDDGAWQVEDVGGGNPVLINGRVLSWPVRCVSGDTLQVGTTHIDFFHPDHPIAKPITIEGADSSVLALARPSRAWPLYTFMLLTTALWSYTAIWNEKPAMVLTSTTAIISAIVIIWAGLWSVAGRMAHRTASFSGHIAIASFYIIILFIIWTTNNAIGFLLNENPFSQIFSYITESAALIALVYGSLTLATKMTKLRRIIISSVFSIGLSVGTFTVGTISAHNFTKEVPMPILLEPYLAPLAPITPNDAFTKENAELFKSKTLITHKQ